MSQQPQAWTPGQPVYPQGQVATGQPYQAYPYAQPYAQPYWVYPYPAMVVKRREPGEIYALVVAWIVFAFGILSIIGGLLLLLVAGIATANGSGDSLAVLTTFAGFTLGPILGGVLAIVYSISRVIKRPSPPPSLPSSLAMLMLTIFSLAAAVILWHFYTSPGLAFAILPLALLSGFLPALTILAYGVQQLGPATTRRHLWLSLFFGATMAPLFAIIFEAIAALLILWGLAIIRPDLTPGISSVTDTAPRNASDAIFLLLVIAVVAPLVEEGLKPLGVVLIVRRLRSPAEAFLLGLAAGIGFDMVETIGYIGSGQADWVSISIQRIGAGLLHGLGAAMAALGWYYLINGKGVPHRWLKGFGGLVYAVIQHGIFNASNLLGLLPGPVGDLMSKTTYLGRLPLDSGTILFFGYYAIILGILVYMIGRLRRNLKTPAGTAATSTPSLPTGPEPQPVAGGAR
ncbi:MAG TPA: PrsW family glutamic-type intramembrane protease [Ktedonobacterales bacterium]|nr:PrsW family glutamic-type intramembrane protease [Ktedonobacterales bacterium]